MRKGSITIFALITMLIVFMICLYVSHITVMESYLQNNLRDKLQNNYDLETSLNCLINDFKKADSEVNKSIIKYCSSPLMNQHDSININHGDLEENVVADLDYNIKDNHPYVNVSIKSPNKNYNALLKANIDFVNEFFTFNNLFYVNDNSFITRPDLEKDLLDFWSVLADSYEIPPLKSGMHSMTLYHSEEITLKRISTNEYKVYRKEAVDNYYKLPSEAFIYIENKAKYDKVKLIIDSNNENDYFKGIIYVEGDIYIVDNFKFNGIIIVNGGEMYIEDGKSALITGKLISSNSFTLPEALKVKYSPEIMNKYGIYLPNYIKGELRNSKIIYWLE